MTVELSEEEKIKIYPDEKGKQIHKKIREKALECEYLNTVNKVKDNKNQNRGEKDEILLLMKLFYLNKTQQYEKYNQNPMTRYICLGLGDLIPHGRNKTTP